MVTRREWLAALAVVPLGGCTGGGNGEQHTLAISNVGTTERQVRVRVSNSDDVQLFTDQVTLEGDSILRGRIVRGDPATVEVVVDEGAPTVFEWAPERTTFSEQYPEGCGGESTVSIRIEVSEEGFDPAQAEAGQTSGIVRLVYGCSFAGAGP